ncbi:MAG: TatD family hydrolase [Bacteroides sp.]|nr:TatD family hydrolase [Prevotella sp.]MCM1408701.1 TatD family hydrolase [Treponema brennaborense]MCM1470562.1 TatD family hydrolase [Bacteroides sp.]
MILSSPTGSGSMFSDTHCHLSYLEERGVDCAALFSNLASGGVPFLLDAGTRCDDLAPRTERLSSYIRRMPDDGLRRALSRALYFSAGIWPDAHAVEERYAQMETLRRSVEAYRASCLRAKTADRLLAVGECGIDRHWNADGADARTEADFPCDMLRAEEELFELQLEFARDVSLPVIVHSRDAFPQTSGCIKNVGYNRGVIHCFSYGIDAARVFLDSGWYISFSGSVTYTKKNKLEEMYRLIRYVPRDRLLLETDAPYLAPVPHRGSVNTPLLIKHTYRFAAAALDIPPEALAGIVKANAQALFCCGSECRR